MKIKLSILVVLLVMMAGSSYAADNYTHMLDQITPAWQRLDALTKNFLNKEQQEKAQELAFAAAAADLCDGLKVDREKFIAAFKDLEGEEQKAMSEDEERQWKNKLLVAYGIATGLFSAEGLLGKESFCLSAKDVKKTSPDHYWEEN